MAQARLWPGVLAIEPPPWAEEPATATVVFGPLAGRAEVAYIEDWKDSIVLVRREDLPPEAWPEAGVDLSELPRVLEDLETAVWMLVPRVPSPDLEQVEVSFHRVAGGGGLVYSRAGEQRSLAIDPGLQAEHAPDVNDVSELFDRLLRAISDGRCSMRDVALACDQHLMLTPEMIDRLDERQQELLEVDEFAEAQHEDNQRLMALFTQVSPDVETIELPGVGVARRVCRPGFSWPCSGAPVDSVTVPAEDAWEVDDVAPGPSRFDPTG